jgi:hypothetical protein
MVLNLKENDPTRFKLDNTLTPNCSYTILKTAQIIHPRLV